MNPIDRFTSSGPQPTGPRPAPSSAPTRAAGAAPSRPAGGPSDQFATLGATPENVANSLDDAGKRAFMGLPKADQEAYAAAWQASGPQGRDQLGGLLKAGTLSQQDAQGHTLIATLGSLPGLQVPTGAPYSGNDVLGQLLDHLANPEVINQGDTRNTCGATTVMYMLLKEQPAEYVRVAAGLMGDGQVTLRSGGTMQRVFDSVDKDGTNRDDVERVVESAFQDYGPEVRGRYSNKTDDFQQGPREGTSIWAKIGRAIATPANAAISGIGAQGIAEGKVANLYQELTGHQAKLVGDLPGGLLLAPLSQRQDVFDQVKQAVTAGKQVPVDIVLKDLHDKPGEQQESIVDQQTMGYSELMASHQVLVEKFENGRVYYRNPWGYQTSMSEAEFKSRLTDGIIPE